ncbi:MAG: hypothetical protein QOH31_2867 [Verrucomicrobiota bacterium]|jgi:hypothetical protein
MAFVLGDCADTIGKIQSLRKIGKSKNSFQSLDSIALNQGPFGNQRLEFENLRFSDSRRIASAGGALFVFQRFHSRWRSLAVCSPEYRLNIACLEKQKTRQRERKRSGNRSPLSSTKTNRALIGGRKDARHRAQIFSSLPAISALSPLFQVDRCWALL